MALNDLQLKKLSPRESRFEVSDGKGLSIRIMSTGTKTWVFRYMIDGKARRMTLGTYPAISLSEARKKHAMAMQEIERGVDPGEKQKAENAARKAAPTFSDLLEEFWSIELKYSPSGKERRRLVEKDAITGWRNRKVADITRRDAVLLLDGVRERAPITANRLQGVLVRMFNFAAERGIIEHSPLTGMKKKPEKARSRVLNDEEIQLLWNVLELSNSAIDLFHVSKLALKMILLTGQRPGEVCGMTWGELDQNDFWNIPGERRKGKIPQRVPLSEVALEVIEQARAYSGESEFVFPSPQKPTTSLRTHTLSKAIIRHWKEIGLSEPFTPHDLRRTVRTRLSEIGINDVVAECVLGHKLQGIQGVYNRHSYDNEKRQALEKWATKLQKIVGIEPQTKGKIIPLRRVAL